MTLDRLQAAWPYLRTEVLRPMFRQFEANHEDLAVAVLRTLLVRPPGMRRILEPQGTHDTLDQLLADRDTYIDSATDARNALARIKSGYRAGVSAPAMCSRRPRNENRNPTGFVDVNTYRSTVAKR